MAQKSILITGCSSGLGRHAALTLEDRGWRVFASCRLEADCEDLRRLGFDSPRLDYTDEPSIERSVAEVLEATGGTLDAVANNGAHALLGFVEDVPRDAYRAIFEANLFGPFDLTRRLMPTFRAQGHGRIVNTSSVLAIAGLRGRGAYNATKGAMDALNDTLRRELHGTGIHVSNILPGPIGTPIRRKSQPHFERWIDWEGSAVRAAYEGELKPRLYEPDTHPDDDDPRCAWATRALIHAIEASKPRPRYLVTWETVATEAMRRLLPTPLLDRALRSF